ncbi:MAG: hypothetical protein ACRBFS_09455 [Aureispira sp.]
MLKVIGLIAVIASIFTCFQSQWISGLLSASEEDLAANVMNASTRGTDNPEKTVYAAGYSETDFGDAFTSPNEGKFAVEEEILPDGIWADLLQLKFKISFDEEVDDVTFQPKFTELIRSYEGQIIEVEGYIIPHNIAADAMGNLEDKGDKFMFSAFPLASCFFCGGAGSESVMEAFPKDPINYTEKRITLRGRLKLNEKDLLKLPYIIEDVALVIEK